ncbi:hypothetical protein LCGC14_0659400 [marine sediment metagenome]|uniref:Cthe-2314-like HEPN domain-containing protein n=1 Tax=marine sediment metagenome TaxID=412755 RepID=A0A0F9QZ61_9ZZZZ|nr:hypothetical protein [bacterium]
MYSPNDFNRNNLFQKFNGWIEWANQQFVENYHKQGIIDDEIINKEWIKSYQSYNMILIHANFIIINIQQMKLLEKKCIQEYKNFANQIDIRHNRIIFWSPTLINLISKVSPILSSIHFIQDKIINIIGKKLNKPLGNRMRKVISGGKEKYSLPTGIFGLLRKYWIKSGEAVRKYRDIDQHHYSLINNSFIEVEPNERILIILPDNPEVKKIEEFTFKHEKDTIRYLEEAFSSLHDFIEGLAGVFGFKNKKYSLTISLGQYGEFSEKRGTIALRIHNIKTPEALRIAHDGKRLIINIIRK